MDDLLLSSWHSSSKSKGSVTVIPDGCRDLILKIESGKQAIWFISPLFDQAKIISIEANTMYFGYRMRPGVHIAEEKLLRSVQHYDSNTSNIINMLYSYTTRNHALEEALNCLAGQVRSAKLAAKNLGVSLRTLQRLVYQETHRSPTYWMSLARARKTARALKTSHSLAEIAEIHGYADQSHMNREFRRWFNVPPGQMRQTPSLLDQLHNKGYD